MTYYAITSKQTNFLHYAEPANAENNDDSWDREWEASEEIFDEKALLQRELLMSDSERKYLQGRVHIND